MHFYLCQAFIQHPVGLFAPVGYRTPRVRVTVSLAKLLLLSKGEVSKMLLRPTTSATDLDRRLMFNILYHWGPKIRTACRYSSIPAEFLAALIANESEGDPDRTRFHYHVHRALLAVQSGEQYHFAGVTQKDLQGVSDGEALECAVSWGLTQIMGYQALYEGELPRRLLDPDLNLRRALQLLATYAENSLIDLRLDFEDLFLCWNAGRPNAETSGLEYAERGLRRLLIYRELTQTGPAAAKLAA